MINQKAISWGISTGEVIVYPKLAKETYTFNKQVNGKRRKITLNKVKLIIQIGNKRVQGKFEYMQDDQMSQAISDIYTYYYDRYKQSKINK
tara:strand:- start:2254 stop:2526 length:273 start_codon:yes stop_codon:yes gene_type:complete